jgi:hypothetical protein
LVPRASPTASPASASSGDARERTKYAAHATNDAVTRSFCVLDDWSAISARVANTRPANTDDGREKPRRRAIPATARTSAAEAASCASAAARSPRRRTSV